MPLPNALMSRRMQALWDGHARKRLSILALTLIFFGMALGGLEPEASVDDQAFVNVLSLDLPAHSLPAPPIPGAGQPAPGTNLTTGPEWQVVEVQPGQSLDGIFHEQGLSATLLHSIMALNDETRGLKKIKPGQKFGFVRGADGSFQRMRYPLDENRFLFVEQQGEQLNAYTRERELTTRLLEARGDITSSLFLAGKAAGLSDGMVMKLANIFGWDIDFILDIRAGDQFYLLYEKIYRDGEYLRDGEVLAATFINQGEKYQAVRYEADNGPQYYAADGRHMRKAFLRAPLNFSYISSNFNPKRFHPILKTVRPHNGIDYRAPTGTPVYAAGDGRVIRSAKDQYNGNHVFIQHANSVVTRYLHFSSRKAKAGDRVRQGDVIGYVGMTGLAEAPHLHYEFLLNGVHRNPRTVSLPTVKPLEGDFLTQFRQHAAPYLNQLDRLESASLYASTGGN